MNVTISTHNGSTVKREHNIRNRKVTDKEQHIRKEQPHETWLDVPIRQAYEDIFGEAVKAYNARQKRSDRQIKNYYKTICDNDKKHPAYEMIIGIYGKDENGKPICNAEQGKAIMREFVDTWQDRNQNLKLIGVYYHADEEGEPHVHIDYIPVAHGYKTGLSIQTALSKALGEQGFVKTKDNKDLPIVQWERRENAVLSELCERAGLTVDHPQAGNKDVKHYETEIYKLREELETTKEKLLAYEQKPKRHIAESKEAYNERMQAQNQVTAVNQERKRQAKKDIEQAETDKKQAEIARQLEAERRNIDKIKQEEYKRGKADGVDIGYRQGKADADRDYKSIIENRDKNYKNVTDEQNSIILAYEAAAANLWQKEKININDYANESQKEKLK